MTQKNSIEDESVELPKSKGADEKVVVSTTCKGCGIDFSRATILKHISHSKLCKTYYTKEEFLLFKDWGKEINAETRRISYDCGKRRQKYISKDKVRLIINST